VLLDDMPMPRLRVYPRYTVIAEKLHAIVSLGITNSRMKDFFDLWILTRHSELDATILRQAVTATSHVAAMRCLQALRSACLTSSPRMRQSRFNGAHSLAETNSKRRSFR
jgi:hypothetical protein